MGQYDATVVKVWLDNGCGVFNPALDPLLGQLSVSTSGAFSNGVALVPLSAFERDSVLDGPGGGRDAVRLGRRRLHRPRGGLDAQPYARLRAREFHGPARAQRRADRVAVPDAISAAAGRDPNLTLISPLTVPGVSISSALPPIIVTRAGPGVPAAAVGYLGVYALISPACNTSGSRTPRIPRNNICLDGSNLMPDMTKWMCPDGTPWCGNGACTIATCSGPPLIDVNGDGRPDNFSIGQSTLPNQVSLLGNGVPTTVLIPGSGVLDVDINKDGIPDIVIFTTGSAKPQFRIGLDPADPGDYGGHRAPIRARAWCRRLGPAAPAR